MYFLLSYGGIRINQSLKIYIKPPPIDTGLLGLCSEFFSFSFFLSWPLPFSKAFWVFAYFVNPTNNIILLFFLGLADSYWNWIEVISWILPLWNIFSLCSSLCKQTSHIFSFFLFFLIKGFLGLGLFGKNFFHFLSIFHILNFFTHFYKKTSPLCIRDLCVCGSYIVSFIYFVLKGEARWWEERLRWGA